MARPKFDPKELDVIGKYPNYTTSNTNTVEEPRYNTPITPKENWKLLFSGKRPYWIPVSGRPFSDILTFRPRMHPDNYATHLVTDAEGPIEYKSNLEKGLFDLLWEWVPMVGGATVHPGNPAVPDINQWEKYVPFPNLDDMDWESCIEKNREYCKTDKLVEVAMLSGLWERLISLMDVENAAIALIDDEQKEGVHRLFDRLCDFYDGYIDRLHKSFGIDAFLIHDDWGHQRGPFFSLDTCREMLVPYTKRIAESCHKRGIIFELHCCGKDERLVPAMIEAGVDIWCGQDMNDYYKLATTYKDSPLVFGVRVPVLPPETPTEEVRQKAKEFVELYKGCNIAIVNSSADPRFLQATYEFSRKAYEDCGD